MISPIFEDHVFNFYWGRRTCVQLYGTAKPHDLYINQLTSMNWSLKKIKLKKQRKSDLDQKEENQQPNQFILSIRFFDSKHKHTLGGWSSEGRVFWFFALFFISIFTKNTSDFSYYLICFSLRWDSIAAVFN